MDSLEKTPSEESAQGEPTWTPEAERRLVRKIDLSLLPMLWLMNLLSWMDRANLGNANIAGLTSDLKLSSSQFSLAVVIYYVGYTLSAPISSLLLSRSRPSLYLPTLMSLWGLVTALTSLITSLPALLACRILIGVLEAGLTPGMVFIFSAWYTPSEMGKRTALFLTSAQCGGLFGGLIAGGLMRDLEGARGMRGWRWLFLVEGVVTVAVAAVGYGVLVDYPESPGGKVRGGRFFMFSEGERGVAVGRLRRAGTVTGVGVGRGEGGGSMGLGGTVRGAVREWRVWLFSVATAMYSGAAILTYFYPVLVKGLGYTDPIMAQYMTAPIWGVAVVFNLASGFAADRIPHYRGLVVVAGLVLISLTALLTCVIHNFTARYVLLSFMTGGLWVAYSQCLAYLGDLFRNLHPDVRSFAIGMTTVAAQMGYFYGAYCFPAENAPKHLLGFGMVAGSSGCSSGLYFLLWWAARYFDRKRSRESVVG
ncbi:MFS general substrate transporter [Podospora aff. communis PSN243]|uniref:MFS general substrate transporter n=1 Tax=Podospora aff. communis PSN243 TaxID=3040156 RepID=A0AAV9G6I6_9PEZI|nr:MFS general substrate transporter [Podospora aff. communis PSN243]